MGAFDWAGQFGQFRKPAGRNSAGGEHHRLADRKNATSFHFLIKLDAQMRPTDVFSTALLDISECGCGLMEATPLEPGTRVGLVLFRNEWEAHVGEVCYCKAEPSGWHHIGVQFQPVPKGIRNTLTDFVCSMSGLPKDARRSA